MTQARVHEPHQVSGMSVQLLEGSADSPTAVTPAEVVPDLLRRAARIAPELVAIRVVGHADVTYGSWARRANAVARGLIATGVRPGDRVALVFDPADWVDFAVSYIAAQKCGAISVPLSKRFSEAELEAICELVEPAIVVTSPGMGVRTNFPHHAVEKLMHDDSSDVDVHREAIDPAQIQLTSGTTGRPKAVLASHANLLFQFNYLLRYQPAVIGQRTLHAHPLSTQAGQSSLIRHLACVGTSHILPSFTPSLFASAVIVGEVEAVALGPSMANALLHAKSLEDVRFESVREVSLTSAPTPAPLVGRLKRLFPCARFLNFYSSTEAAPAYTFADITDAPLPTVGKPAAQTDIRIVGPDGRDTPLGCDGEVHLRNGSVPHRTYFRDDVANAETFVGGWVRTADIGHIDADGNLHLTDRRADLIVSGGDNVSSLEVEGCLMEHPAVSEAAVFAAPDDLLGEAVAAAVVLKAWCDPSTLQWHVRERLASHKVPTRFLVLDELPRNASGKVLKEQLRSMARSGSFDWASFATQSDQQQQNGQGIDELVKTTWRALGLDVSDPAADFFALGGDSRLAIQLSDALSHELGIEIDPILVYERPTLDTLATALRELASAARATANS